MAGLAAGAPSPEGWQFAKPLIEQLYIQQDKPLKQVRSFMEEHYSFVATERMFKQRLKEWGFDRKKVKAAEWRYMLRLTRQRGEEGKESAFRVNGKPIVWSNIRKHLKRKKKTVDEFLSAGPDAETVEDVICYTPPARSPTVTLTHSTPSVQLIPMMQSNTFPGHISARVPGEEWHREGSKVLFNPMAERVAQPEPKFSAYDGPSKLGISVGSQPFPASLTPESNKRFSLSSSRECSSIPEPELQSIALRPISIKCSPPLDEVGALRISLMMTGLYSRFNSASRSGQQQRNVSTGLQNEQAEPRSGLRAAAMAENWHSEPRSTADQLLTDEDIASRWAVYYFQACICESQGKRKDMEENVRNASRVFKDMLQNLNPYLLTGLTLMTSILYFHDHARLAQQFLEDSCHTIEKVFSNDHPIMVPYRYMVVSVSGEQKMKSQMSRELLHAYEAFQLTWGGVHSNTLTALYYYACSLLEGGRYDEAETKLQMCFELSDRHLGPYHFLTVWTLATRSRSLSTSGRGKEAEAVRHMQAAIKRCRHMMHEDHPYYLELNRYLATIYMRLRNFGAVESLYRFVVNGRIKMLGIHREITKASVNDLYDVLMAQNKVHEATHLRATIRAMEDRGEGYPIAGISC